MNGDNRGAARRRGGKEARRSRGPRGWKMSEIIDRLYQSSTSDPEGIYERARPVNCTVNEESPLHPSTLAEVGLPELFTI